MDANYGKVMGDINRVMDAKDSSISESLDQELRDSGPEDEDSFDDDFYHESGEETAKKPKR